MKDGQKIQKEQRTMPGYLLVNMDMTDDSWSLVKNTPGVTGFVGASAEAGAAVPGRGRPADNRETAERPRTRAQFSIGESVKVVSGPLSDFSGEISEINEDAAKLKVLVSIFGRETPVEVGFDQVKKTASLKRVWMTQLMAQEGPDTDQAAGPRRAPPTRRRRSAPRSASTA